MKIEANTLKTKLNYLGLGITNKITTKQIEKLLLIEKDSKSDKVYGYTYDGINNVKVELGTTDEDDFYALVEFSSFYSFIKSCDGDISLETTDKFIQIKASNVKCKLPTYNHEVPRGKTGMPDPTNNTYDNTLSEQINMKLYKSVIDTEYAVEAYRYVYFGDNIVVSNTDDVIINHTKLFDYDFMLDMSSINLLSSISNIQFGYGTDNTNKLKKLYIKSDELLATINVILNSNDEFQYDDFIDLDNSISGDYTVIDTNILSKAVSTASMFDDTIKLVFNEHGVFIRVDSVDFIYKVNSDKCIDKTVICDKELIKKITSIGNEVKVFYDQNDLIKCKSDNISAIFSVKME